MIRSHPDTRAIDHPLKLGDAADVRHLAGCDEPQRSAASRRRCIVPYCKRTTARADFDEWICGDHWRLIDKQRRRVYGRHLRRWRRYGSSSYGPTVARIWRAIRAQAIERAAGIQ